MDNDIPKLATKGLIGWTVRGKCDYGSYIAAPYNELPDGTFLAYDLSKVYETHPNPAALIWKQPNLDLSLPDDNVRNLFEGCIGSPGTTQGHPWDGTLDSLKSFDSVGLNVYIKVLVNIGAVKVR